MSNVIHFPRQDDIQDLAYHAHAGGLGWYWRSLSTRPPGPHIVLRCEHHHEALGSKHSVSDDGTVSPSLVWMRYDETTKTVVPGCCHLFARLVGWTTADSQRLATVRA